MGSLLLSKGEEASGEEPCVELSPPGEEVASGELCEEEGASPLPAQAETQNRASVPIIQSDFRFMTYKPRTYTQEYISRSAS